VRIFSNQAELKSISSQISIQSSQAKSSSTDTQFELIGFQTMISQSIFLVVERNSRENCLGRAHILFEYSKISIPSTCKILSGVIVYISSSLKYCLVISISSGDTSTIKLSLLVAVKFEIKFKKLPENTKNTNIERNEINEENTIKKDTFPGLIVERTASKL